MDEAKLSKVKTLIEEFRKALMADGGDCELVKVEEMTIYLRLKGHCGTCPHAQATLKNYIQQVLNTEVDPAIVVERAE